MNIKNNYDMQAKGVGIGFYIDCKIDVTSSTLVLNCIKPSGATCHFDCTPTYTNFAYYSSNATGDFNETGTWEAQIGETLAGQTVFGKSFKFKILGNLGGF